MFRDRIQRCFSFKMIIVLMLVIPIVLSASEIEEELINRGRYIAQAADCMACHQGNKKDDPPYVGGHAIDSPIGKIIGSNITPSVRSGIGSYTEEQFKRALTQGYRADGVALYPAMPYASYKNITDEDMHALYTYFMKGVEPVDRDIAQTKLAFPFNLRYSVRMVGLAFAHDHPQGTTDLGTEQLERGRYIVDALGHCGMCHTPRDFFMAEDNRSHYLAGGMVGTWYAPNITSDRVSGIGAWSEAELLQYFRTGNVEGKGQAAGEMATAIEHGLRHLSDADLKAAIAYLKQVPAISTTTGNRASFDYSGVVDRSTLIPTEKQERLYSSACAACHRMDGRGAYDNHFPSLAYNSAVGHNIPNNLVMAVLEGVDRKSDAGYAYMPAFGNDLNDAEVAALVNYISDHFGNPEAKISEESVALIRQGGERPMMVVVAPFLGWGGIIFGTIVLISIIRFWIKRRRKKA